MKLSHILGIVVIALAIGIIVATAGDASSYVTFRQATELAKDGDDKLIHVVGKVQKDAQGRVVDVLYNPAIDPNHFEFTLVDNDQRAEKVVFNSPKRRILTVRNRLSSLVPCRATIFNATKSCSNARRSIRRVSWRPPNTKRKRHSYNHFT